MVARYRSVAVIGTGPSGVSAVRALSDENVFDTIRVFERRNQSGGLWHYDPIPDPFPGAATDGRPGLSKSPAVPANLPQFAPPAPEDLSARSAVYDTLDSNVGAELMAFTHTPFPLQNSAASVERFGSPNPTRPFRVVFRYLQDLLQDYLHLVSFNTTVEKVEKTDHDRKWTLTLRRSGQLRDGQPLDYWWQEKFDAVVVASGHYNVPLIPDIPGLEETAKSRPRALEHSKAFRSADNYVDKRVVVVGASVSASDLVSDLHAIVRGPLYLSQRGKNEVLDSAWNLPNVERKPAIRRIEPDTETTVKVTFTDDSIVDKIDKILFGTGYRLSYPFLTPDPVTFTNRLAGFYQHIFKISDPSLAVVGQVRGALSFRVYEYQAVAVARYFAGREAKQLPSPVEQERWEIKRLEYKGPSSVFHEIKPDLKEYFNYLREFAGPAAPDSTAYELPEFDDKWPELGFSILQLKDAHWKGIKERHEKQLRSKL